MSTQDRALLTLASCLCPQICDPYNCCIPNKDAHYVNLEVEDGVLRVVRRDWETNDCGCAQAFPEIPADLSKCILSALEVWCELRDRNKIIFTPEYCSSSPDLPSPEELVDYITCNCKKRPVDFEGSMLSDNEPPPPPVKQMRTGPCQDIVKKIERREAEEAAKKADDKEGVCSEDE
ncbi:hypothetical protein V5O48_014091 [Marasmius crinis-equi]|uniref:Uncharacterized protein n=1 Tax=Marasmius crinis-equi TaxID=585013 RepID=A0ABR3EYA2_9AGAR